MKSELKDLLDLLDLEQIEVNLFRGVSPKDGRQRVFGGQVLGQALVAAARTVDDTTRSAHSLHGYFLRPGDASIPILYKVDRIRDGRSFTTRRVVAIQHGRAIFNMSASFQILEQGLEHQMPMPTVAPPDACLTEAQMREAFAADRPDNVQDAWERTQPIEIRHVEPINQYKPEPLPPYQHTWIRAIGTMPDDVRLNQCLLAYASDMTLLDTSILPHALNWNDANFQVASLDHAMWFHRPFKADEWLLYSQDSPSSSGARGFNRGTFFTSAGELVASVAQEGLIRLHR